MTLQKGRILVGIGIAAAVVVGAVCLNNSSKVPQDDKSTSTTLGSESKNSKSDSSKKSNVSTAGSILKPTKRIQDKTDPKVTAFEKKLRDELDYGRTQPVAVKGNPAAKSIVEAIKTGKNLERVSMFHRPKKPFDKSLLKPENSEAYKKYLSVHAPGRIYQTATPGKDVPILRIVGKNFHKVKPGETVTLSVGATPNAPVTFASSDLGSFKNGLQSITVKADSRGLARAEFKATPGASFDCRINAGCPLAAGNVRFIVNIHKKN